MSITTPATTSRRGRRFTAIVFGILVGWILSEGLAALHLYSRHYTLSIPQLLVDEQCNKHVQRILNETELSAYAATLYPHPYLGHVHRKYPGGWVNSVGMIGPEFPQKRDSEHFYLLVTGGSVANQFAQLRPGGVVYLEDILNERYDFGGRRVVVLNGGQGAWKQPQQVILLALYAQAIDAAISIEGFNEHYSMKGWDFKLEYPSGNFHNVNPIAVYGYDRLLWSYLANKVYSWSTKSVLVRHSYLLYLTTRTAREKILAWVDDVRKPQPANVTTTENIFRMPGDWSRDEYGEYNLELYQKYVREFDAIAKSEKLPHAIFIQPVPAIGKTLTPEERKAAGDLSYGGVYGDMANALLSLRDSGVPVFSLLDVFHDVNERVYVDAVHCETHGERQESLGYRLMAERIAEILENEWELKRRSAVTAAP